MQTSRAEFLILATAFQGSIAAIGLTLGWLTGTNPLHQMKWTTDSVLTGAACTIPMLALFAVTYHLPLSQLKKIKEFLWEALGPALVECRWYELVWVAILAGFSEEILFRGVLQSWLRPTGWITGLVVSNVVFGLAHFVTPTYALLAGLMGIYLGLVHEVVGNQNLLIPVLAHAIYDLIAFIVVRRTYRPCSESTRPASKSAESNLEPRQEPS